VIYSLCYSTNWNDLGCTSRSFFDYSVFQMGYFVVTRFPLTSISRSPSTIWVSYLLLKDKSIILIICNIQILVLRVLLSCVVLLACKQTIGTGCFSHCVSVSVSCRKIADWIWVPFRVVGWWVQDCTRWMGVLTAQH